MDDFKKLAKGSFRQRVSTKLLGYIASLWTDSYYEESAIVKALKATFGDPDDGLRFLIDAPCPARQHPSPSHNATSRLSDLKLAVTAVNVITGNTTLMTNYNRKTSNDGELNQPLGFSMLM